MVEDKRKFISETLIAEIGAGKFAGRFPSERALVRRFAAARETVRAALRELEEMRLIRRKVGSGTTVIPTESRRRLFAIMLGNGYNVNPFYTAIRNGVETALAKRGCALFSVSAPGHRESERMSHAREFTRMCVGERISGVFMQPLHFLRNSERANRAILSALDEAHIPVVLIDSDFVQPPRRSAYDLVGTDNLRIGYDLARHMIDAGAKRIVYVSEPRPAPTSMLRGMGVGLAVSEAGLKWRKEDMVFMSGAEMRTTVRRLFSGKKRPDAVIACHDYMGVELLEELRRVRVNVPGDVLLAGVDGDHVSAECDPPLTTFVQPCEEIGVSAVNLMLSRVENPLLPPREVLLASHLVIRASTAQFAKKG
ncbi:MAG: substrate-binding domain-containing protein [Kiritimatiellae bacterium]|nr:substrate-binding domain-containing protein [Kiritimatiellia bacterium]